MQIIKKGQLSILIPEDGYELINKNTGVHSEKVYLAKADSMDNYIEVMKENYISGLANLKEKTDAELLLLIDTIDGLISLLEPVIISMPFMIDESSNNPIEKIIRFYTEMIKKGYRNLEDIPGSFRALIRENFNK